MLKKAEICSARLQDGDTLLDYQRCSERNRLL